MHKILNISEHASIPEIKTAYKNLAKIWHPDKHHNKSKEELDLINIKFNKIATAYQKLLSNNGSSCKYMDCKKDYDDIDNIYFQKLNIDESQNIALEENISIQDLYFDGLNDIKYQYKKRCLKCVGRGYIDISNPPNCLDCNGNGKYNHKKCNACFGLGKCIEKQNICSSCNGSKYLMTNGNLYYNVSRNTIKNGNENLRVHIIYNKDYQKIYKLYGKGNESETGTGNLVLKINIVHSPIYSINDNNLCMTLEILLLESLIGFCHKLILPDNSNLIINSDNIIKHNQKLIINEFGFNKGVLIVTFIIKYPMLISTECKKSLSSILPSNDKKNHNLKNNIVVNI